MTTSEPESTWVCTGCHPDDRLYTAHTAELVPLACALARHFGHEPLTDEKIHWFMDDADVLLKEAGPGPYEIVGLENGWHSENAFLLNGRLVVTIGEGGKDCPATPEIVAKFPDGLRVEVSQ